LLHQLSSGQQRLVFLARALVKNPPLLILDEPCQGLDHTNMVYFRELVNELAVSLDKTLIYVTHYEEEIPACVNQIFRIDKGKRCH
jgi:molybdate transport system ATP-binding protein